MKILILAPDELDLEDDEVGFALTKFVVELVLRHLGHNETVECTLFTEFDLVACIAEDSSIAQAIASAKVGILVNDDPVDTIIVIEFPGEEFYSRVARSGAEYCEAALIAKEALTEFVAACVVEWETVGKCPPNYLLFPVVPIHNEETDCLELVHADTVLAHYPMSDDSVGDA